jgi:hypothetical protein
VDDLWGFCRTCYYAEVCRGGCTWMADSLLGRPGNNPYCHYRVLELEKQGLRERVVKTRDAPQQAFATGEFALLTEPIPGREPAGDPSPRPPARPAAHGASGDGLPPTLALCRACDCFVWPDEAACPHCGADLAAAAALWDEDVRRRMGLVAELERMMDAARGAS